MNELAEKLGIDPTVIREQNMLREGMKMPAYYGETANACALDRCMARCKEIFNWDDKYLSGTWETEKSGLQEWQWPCRFLYIECGCGICNGQACG